jgi:hypothetical protein
MVLRELSDGPSYAGQQKATLQITATPALYSTTVTTGVIASSYGISPANVLNWATRFGGTFDEYRILSVTMRIRPIAAATGVTTMWFDEKVAAVATSTEAAERTLSLFSNSNASARSGVINLRWSARDLLDLQYTPTGTTTVNPVYFKIYTDNSNYGAPTTVTPMWLLEPIFSVEFRGINP